MVYFPEERNFVHLQFNVNADKNLPTLYFAGSKWVGAKKCNQFSPVRRNQTWHWKIRHFVRWFSHLEIQTPSFSFPACHVRGHRRVTTTTSWNISPCKPCHWLFPIDSLCIPYGFSFPLGKYGKMPQNRPVLPTSHPALTCPKLLRPRPPGGGRRGRRSWASRVVAAVASWIFQKRLEEFTRNPMGDLK